jgi:transcriptional regulator with XRE-family HTH domain
VTGASPTVRQRELGMRLRKLRNDRNLTDVEVANKLLCSATKISRIETGGRRPSLRDVRDLCGVYGVDPDTTTELMELAREARQQGWWVKYDELKVHFPFIGLEQDATAITCYGMYFVPALLQTAEYAQALIKGIHPKIDPVALGQRVEARMHRQRLLEQPKPPRYRALLDEAVLCRQVGGAAVMKAQLLKILQLIQDGKATVQVISFAVGAYAAADSNFDYLEFGGGSPLGGLVFVEGLASDLYHERPAELEQYVEAVEYLRDAALSPRESASKIREISNRYEDSL